MAGFERLKTPVIVTLIYYTVQSVYTNLMLSTLIPSSHTMPSHSNHRRGPSIANSIVLGNASCSHLLLPIPIQELSCVPSPRIVKGPSSARVQSEPLIRANANDLRLVARVW